MNIVGVNKRTYPSQTYGNINLLAVLTKGEADDFACYVGEGSEEFVAASGNKIRYQEMLQHFPGAGIKEENYRL